ncbi:HU domain-containing protein [Fibrella aquatilis]|uniref:SPOR domain-containing protein n=1 Tax=Fibrella aquatilis TaxID=2817059 RepID=A0A939G0G1_9BACT|nr:SPOR domain-containing protein [Fibrella aquatilis]MBO0929674.1 SPOR domain-containing protein [Fibrella aquatilis]
MAMQPIGDYLKKLLYQYDCLVVPGLGAFLTHAVSASYNERDGLFLPPRRRLAFNEAMRLDDGILTNYIMFHEQCHREAALAHIDAFVQEIKQAAQQMGSFSLDGIGLFSLNAENSLQFDPELRHNFLSSAYGMSAVQVQGASVLLAQPVLAVTEEPVRNPVFVVNREQDADEVSVFEMPVRQLSPGWRWAAMAFLAGSLGFISYFTIMHPDTGLQSSLNPAAMFRVFAPSSWPASSTAERETTTPVASLATTPATPIATPIAPTPEPVVPEATPMALAPAPVAVKKAVLKPAKTPAVPARTTPATVVPAADVPATGTPLVATPTVAEPAKAARLIKPFAGSPFAVVVGSFANRANALRLRKRLIAAGYSDATLLPVRKGELIKVAAVGAATLDEAAVSQDSLTQFTGTKALIVRNR